MVPASPHSGMVPMATVSPPRVSASMSSQHMMGQPQQQQHSIMGAVAQPQRGVMSPHAGKIGL